MRKGRSSALSFYVNPETHFDYFNTQLTGIDERVVANAPTFPQLWKTIEPIMGSGILTAHNAAFDMGVLKKCLNHYDVSWKRVPYTCTVCMGRRLLPGMKHNLNCICDYYGIKLDHHKADSDSRAAAEILLRFMRDGADVEQFVKRYSLESLICPRCGKELVLRTARRGENAGKQFYGCSGYPRCRYVKNVS